MKLYPIHQTLLSLSDELVSVELRGDFVLSGASRTESNSRFKQEICSNTEQTYSRSAEFVKGKFHFGVKRFFRPPIRVSSPPSQESADSPRDRPNPRFLPC
jgi:hypothetical protein